MTSTPLTTLIWGGPRVSPGNYTGVPDLRTLNEPGESTILTMHMPGVDPVPVTSNLAKDAVWDYNLGSDIPVGNASPRTDPRINVYPVPDGYKFYLTNVEIMPFDALWNGSFGWQNNEESTNGKYGNGFRWTLRINQQPVAPYIDCDWPQGAYIGFGAPIGNAADLKRFYQMYSIPSKMFYELHAGDYLTISAVRAMDPRFNHPAVYAAIGGTGTLYATKLALRLGYPANTWTSWPTLTAPVLEYFCVARGILAPADYEMDFETLWRLPDFIDVAEMMVTGHIPRPGRFPPEPGP